MNSGQFERWLKKQGIEVKTSGATGHRKLYNPRNGKFSVMPTHGGAKQLGRGLIEKIKKDLGLG